MKKKSKNLIELLSEAQKLIDSQQWSEALVLLLKAKQLDESNATIYFQLGWSHMQLGQFPQAMAYYEDAEAKASHDVFVLNWVGKVYMQLGQWDATLRVLQQALSLDDSYVDTYLNLSAFFSKLGDHKKSLDMTMKAVSLDVSNVSVHLNMGAALLGLGFVEEARVAFETCITLVPAHTVAHLNLAVTSVRQGKSHQAIEDYEKYFEIAETSGCESIQMARYYLGFEFLKTGQLEKGWALYEHGFDSSVPAYVARSPARQFEVPRWAGQPIAGQRLLVWAEQGLGDEILFLSCMRDVLANCADVILECAPRLVAVMARSFPTVTVRAAAFAPGNFNQSVFHDFDYHIPMGSLPGLYRQSLQDFQHSRPFVITDEGHKERFNRRLEAYEGKLKVGICWRSGLLKAERNQDYSAILEWVELLQMPHCVFVNLQYGDCEAELTEVEALFGISIVRWQDLDLKNDIDEVFALIDCLDLVVTAPTAVHAMAGSLGKSTLLVQGSWDWSNLGSNFFPWYASTQCFVCSNGQTPAAMLPQVAALVAELSPAKAPDAMQPIGSVI